MQMPSKPSSQKENIEVEKFSDCEENRKDSDIAS